jgi:hypothetical protein
MTDPGGITASQLQAYFRQLGSFPGAGFPRDDKHLVRADRPRNLFPFLHDRKICWELDVLDYVDYSSSILQVSVAGLFHSAE